MTELYEMESVYIECDCHTELMQLTYESPKETGIDDETDFLYISLYELGIQRDGRLSIKDRLKHIWYIIRHGTPWQDQIILRTEERRKLTEFLNRIEKEKRLKYEKNI